MSDRLDRILTAILTVTAALMVIAFVRREMRGAPAGEARAALAPVYVAEWETAAAAGILIGQGNAPVKIVVFMDFECPFCRRADSSLTAIRARFGSVVALVYVHYPLVNHRFALPAARVAECSASQGRFEQMSKVLFAKQDSLGLKSWESFAAEAGVRNASQFASCSKGNDPVARVTAGLDVGKRIGVRATPTIIVNGWRYASPPTYSDLERDVERLLTGKSLGEAPKAGRS